MGILRIDNIFFNTSDVKGLATHYSKLLGTPVRREQVEGPGLMWAEIEVGGMELSFRKANATPSIHSHLAKDFLELPPGKGATVSFEVDDIRKTRGELQARGVKFRGDIIACTDGKELIAIAEDHSGRPFQLYQANFDSPEQGVKIAMRGVSAAVASLQTSSPVVTGSNLRGVGGAALSLQIPESDLPAARKFYGDVLGLKVASQGNERLTFNVDGSILEFVSPKSAISAVSAAGRLQGGIPLVEVRSVEVVATRLNQFLSVQIAATALDGKAEVRKKVAPAAGRLPMKDPDGNSVQFWARTEA